MMLLVIAVQIVLPLLLLLWTVCWPARNRVGLVLQVLGVGVFLFALTAVSQWAVPVWWLPRVYGVLWLLAVLATLISRRGAASELWPNDVRSWVSVVLSVGLLIVGAGYGGVALSGRLPPSVEIVDIANPFGPGEFLVGHGGSNILVNGHLRTLDKSVERFRPWRGQSRAVDFFGVGKWGMRASGWRPAEPSAYAIFGARLHAPCNGTVIAAEESMPDFQVPEQDTVNRLGNHVILRCDDAEIVLAHMRQDSIAVVVGDMVSKGDLLGEVGNSGASTEPHLHIHAQRPAPAGAPLISGEPLALRIDGRFLVRNDHLSGRSW